MHVVQLYAVEKGALRPLPVAEEVSGFDQLYSGLELGVYSALRTYEHNKFLHLAHHIQRTRDSMALLGWADHLDEPRLRQALHEVCTNYPLPEARVRFDILAAPPQFWGTTSRLLIGLMPFSPPPRSLYETGVRVDFAPNLARRKPLAKTADFAQERQAYKSDGEIYEYLLLNSQGQILEGTGTNFFGVRGGTLHTAGTGVLAGVTRQIILDLAHQLQVPVSLDPIRLAEISFLTEAALSGSSRALLPVVQIGQQRVGNGRPGPVCQKLLAAYESYVAREIRTAV